MSYREIVVEVPPVSTDVIEKIVGSTDPRIAEIAGGNPGAAHVLVRARDWFSERSWAVNYSWFLDRCVALGWTGSELWVQFKNKNAQNIESLVNSMK